jgi:hypothetical protein
VNGDGEGGGTYICVGMTRLGEGISLFGFGRFGKKGSVRSWKLSSLVWANHGGWSSLLARWSTSSAFIYFCGHKYSSGFGMFSGFCLDFFY